MSAIVDQIMDRPVGQRIGMWVISVVALLGIYWMNFYSATSEELVAAKEEVEDLHTQISTQRRLISKLPQVKKEVRQLEVKLEQAKQELPDKREIPELLASISDLATDAGLEVALFKPKAENIREFYAEVPVAVSVHGSFHQVATFFDEVGQLDRIVNITNINLVEPKVNDSVIKLRADCVTTTFRYLEEHERKAREKAKKKGRRR